jgi:MFS family permease
MSAGSSMPPWSQVLAVKGFAPLFAASSISTWGDYMARLTIAAVVYQRTASPLATATTFAVSLLPSIFGRTLLGPLADRIPYRTVLFASHVSRAVMVLVLVGLIAAEVPVPALLLAFFVLETFGGPAQSAQQVLMTDLFQDRRVFVGAMGMTALGEQVNQALGFVLGGVAIAVLGPTNALLVDFVTFLVSAAVVALVIRSKPVVGRPSPGLVGFFGDLGRATHFVGTHPVLRRLLGLSLVASLGVSAPEAVALVYAGSPGLGGLLMAAPLAGAAVGVVVVTRWEPRVSNRRMVAMALVMPVPLLFTAFRPGIALVVALWFLSGMLQAFMVPLQSTFSLVTPPERRGTIFGLAGALSVTAAGGSYLLAGWLSEVTNPASAVTMLAVVCLGAVLLLAARWPTRDLDDAVEVAYAS